MISCVVAVLVKILNPANFCCFFVSRTVPVPTGEQSEKKRRPCRRFTLSSQQACPCSAWIDSLVTCPRFPEWMPSSSSAHYTNDGVPTFFLKFNLKVKSLDVQLTRKKFYQIKIDTTIVAVKNKVFFSSEIVNQISVKHSFSLQFDTQKQNTYIWTCPNVATIPVFEPCFVDFVRPFCWLDSL